MAKFNPGENIKEFQEFKPSELIINERNNNLRVSVKCPCRIGWNVLDMSTFSPSKPGGGGIGMAISIYSESTVSFADEEKIESKRSVLIKHHIEVFKRNSGFKGNFHVIGKCGVDCHVGLGSTSSLIFSMYSGMNELLEKPFTVEQMRKILAYNYVEENNDGSGTISYGYETGMTSAGAVKGGWSLLSDNAIRIGGFNTDFQCFIVVPPKVENKAPDTMEQEIEVLEECLKTDVEENVQFKKAYIMWMKLVPALEKKSIKEIGEAMWDLQKIGSKVGEINRHGLSVGRFMNQCREKVECVVGMSSIGPSMCVVFESEENGKRIEEIAKENNCEILFVTSIDNTGIVIDHIL